MIKEAIVKSVSKEDLTYEEAYTVMNEIMSGGTTPTQNAAFLAALSVAEWKSGEKAEAVRSLRQAKALARYFDAAPYYGADRLKYAGGKETDGAYDGLGRTAMEAVENALAKNGKKDAEMEKLWKEGSKDEAE